MRARSGRGAVETSGKGQVGCVSSDKPLAERVATGRAHASPNPGPADPGDSAGEKRFRREMRELNAFVSELDRSMRALEESDGDSAAEIVTAMQLTRRAVEEQKSPLAQRRSLRNVFTASVVPVDVPGLGGAERGDGLKMGIDSDLTLNIQTEPGGSASASSKSAAPQICGAQAGAAGVLKPEGEEVSNLPVGAVHRRDSDLLPTFPDAQLRSSSTPAFPARKQFLPSKLSCPAVQDLSALDDTAVLQPDQPCGDERQSLPDCAAGPDVAESASPRLKLPAEKPRFAEELPFSPASSLSLTAGPAEISETDFDASSAAAVDVDVCIAGATSRVAIPKYFTCPVCLDPLRKPVTTLCGHSFCAECISLCYSLWGRIRCPLCLTKLDTLPGVNSVLERDINAALGVSSDEPQIGSAVQVLKRSGTVGADELGILKEAEDGFLDEVSGTLYDSQGSAVEGTTKQPAVSREGLAPCRIAKVDVCGGVWVGRMADVALVDWRRYPLGTRPMAGSLMVWLDEIPQRRDGAVQQLEETGRDAREAGEAKESQGIGDDPKEVRSLGYSGNCGSFEAVRAPLALVQSDDPEAPGPKALDLRPHLSCDAYDPFSPKAIAYCPRAYGYVHSLLLSGSVRGKTGLWVSAESRVAGSGGHAKKSVHSRKSNSLPSPGQEDELECVFVKTKESVAERLTVGYGLRTLAVKSLRPLLRVCTSLFHEIRLPALCCSGCRMLLRIPVRLACGHLYCASCYYDLLENGWPCLECGSPCVPGGAEAVSPNPGGGPRVSLSDGAAAAIGNAPASRPSQSPSRLLDSWLPRIQEDVIALLKRTVPKHRCTLDRGFPVRLTTREQRATGLLLDDPNRVNLWIGFGGEDIEYVHNPDTAEWPALERLSSMRATLRPSPGAVGIQRREGAFFGREPAHRDFALSLVQPLPDHSISLVSRWGTRSFSAKTQKLDYLISCVGLQSDFSPIVALARECGELLRRQKDAMEQDRLAIEVRSEISQNHSKSAPMARIGASHAPGAPRASGALGAPGPNGSRRIRAGPVSARVTAPTPRLASGAPPDSSAGSSAARDAAEQPRGSNGAGTEEARALERRARERRKRLGMRDGSKIWASKARPPAGESGSNALRFPEEADSRARPYAKEVSQKKADLSALLDALPPEDRQRATRIAQLQLRYPSVEFMCTACQRVLRNPVVLPCGCAACRVCASIYSASSAFVCLSCGASLEAGGRKPTFSPSKKLEDDLIRCLPGPALAGGIDIGSFVCRAGSRPGDGTSVGIVTAVRARDGRLGVAVLYAGSGAQTCSPEELVCLEVSSPAGGEKTPDVRTRVVQGQVCEVTCGPLEGLRGLALSQDGEEGRNSHEGMLLVALELGALKSLPADWLRPLSVALPTMRLETRRRALLDQAVARAAAEQAQRKEEIRARELDVLRTARCSLPPLAGSRQGIQLGVQDEYRLPAKYSPVRQALPPLARIRAAERPVRSLPGARFSRPPPAPKGIPESERLPWPGRNAATLARAAEVALADEK